MYRHKTVIPLETWDRKFIFETFSQRQFPYVGLTTPVDVTDLIKTVKENRWSFYGVMSYAVSMAVHSVAEFKRRIEKEQVVEFDNVDLSFTVLNKANNCNFAYVPYTADFSQFLHVFSEQKQKAENALLPVGESGLSCIYVTCTPWYRTTAVVQPVEIGKDDTIPRIGWGAFFEKNGKTMVDFTIQAHHGLIDGYHIHLFLEALSEQMERIITLSLNRNIK